VYEICCLSKYNFGIFGNIVVRPETADLYKARLKNMLSTKCPKFQLSVQRLKIRYGDKCRVLMMQSAPDDANTLINAMKELIKEKTIKFCTWRLYTGLWDEQKQTIIDSQNNYSSNYRSLISKFL
jgi:hypothetical protein